MNGAKCRTALTASHHAIDHLLGELLVGNDTDSLGVEFFDEPISQLDHVGFSMLAGI
jgi:hypothetical protein